MDVYDTDSEDELPAGWEERVTLEGRVYYANHSLRKTQWEHPLSGKKKYVAGELPYGWERKVAEDGQVYFIDHINSKTTYTDPRLAFAIEEKDGRFREIKQRFDAGTSALQVVKGRDLTDNYVIVTGANSGIGFETARTLALHGAHVVLACRNTTKGWAAVKAIKKERPQAELELMCLDLCRLSTVKEFADQYREKHWPIHILILNAGVFSLPHTLTDDGYEATFQTNHLGHYYLVLCLLGILKESESPRIVTVSAESHRFTNLNDKTISEEQLSPPPEYYRAILAYNQSKMCNVLFALECHRRFAKFGITSNVLHPGNVISTNITRHWWLWKVIFTMVRPFAKSKVRKGSKIRNAAEGLEILAYKIP
ncbi:hypothetical protein LSH36_898g00043 [Paralvinella palmiformis]|uniref:WW domain-containing oxidoreductase n=1 Tax=Paralvinella palmiformis TaxID=53620 RepID=A0AAD9MTY6_9ANNE|nr:hypothetical protein LSH36_898g00043 [Paralvinella palmiformis]